MIGNAADIFAAYVTGESWMAYTARSERTVPGPLVLERLVRAAQPVVRVHVMARPPHSLKDDQLVEGLSAFGFSTMSGSRSARLKG